MSLLENIKKECRKQGITIDSLEKTAGIAENSVYRWGKVSPSVDKVQRAAAVLRVTVDELLKEE